MLKLNLLNHIFYEVRHIMINVKRKKEQVSEWLEVKVPNSSSSFATRVMHVFHPLHRVAYSAALPIKWRDTHIPRLRHPFAIYIDYVHN